MWVVVPSLWLVVELLIAKLRYLMAPICGRVFLTWGTHSVRPSV